MQSQDWRLQRRRIRKSEFNDILLWTRQQLLWPVLVLGLGRFAAAVLLLLARQRIFRFLFGNLGRLAVSLQLLDSLLLLLVVLDLFAALLHEHLLEHGVVALVVLQFLVVEMDDLVADVVEERLVVRNDEQSLFPALEIAGKVFLSLNSVKKCIDVCQ